MKKNNNSTEANKQKIKYIDVQLIATLGFILALFISFTLAYDKKLSLENKNGIFNEKEAQNLALFQTTLVFIIAAIFLYVNYEQYKIAKETNDDEQKDLLLQIETSILAIISALIGLYIVFKNYRKKTLEIAETEIT